MDDFEFRPLECAPAQALAALQSEVFSDYAPSPELADVLAAEHAARPPGAGRELTDRWGLAAFRGDTLVGWTQGYRQGRSHFYMLNSGVAAHERRQGLYTRLVQAVLAHAAAQGYVRVSSHHAASNPAVLIAKLRLGFQVSGFEYSEVYGPLVQLSYLVHEQRRGLHAARTRSLRTPPGA